MSKNSHESIETNGNITTERERTLARLIREHHLVRGIDVQGGLHPGPAHHSLPYNQSQIAVYGAERSLCQQVLLMCCEHDELRGVLRTILRSKYVIEVLDGPVAAVGKGRDQPVRRLLVLSHIVGRMVRASTLGYGALDAMVIAAVLRAVEFWELPCEMPWVTDHQTNFWAALHTTVEEFEKVDADAARWINYLMGWQVDDPHDSLPDDFRSFMVELLIVLEEDGYDADLQELLGAMPSAQEEPGADKCRSDSEGGV